VSSYLEAGKVTLPWETEMEQMTDSAESRGGRVELVDIGSGVVELRMTGRKGNPIDLSLIRALVSDLRTLEDDRSCRAVLLTSADRHFSIGATGKLFDAPSWSTADLYEQLPELFRFSKPMVALIRGAAVGGGLGLAMLADFRHAEEGASFAANFTRLGFHPGFGLSVTLPRVVGRQASIDILMSGRRIDAAEACRVGLCDQMSAAGTGYDAARELAARLAATAPLAARSVKATLNQGFAATLSTALARELAEQTRLKQTKDFTEGVAAARDRREPRFLGE
jgi:2-(1,2-epoxy-1,2-dihydrophenyl)acetyl-CoA isomerase